MRAASTFGISFESSKRDNAMTKRAISWPVEIGPDGSVLTALVGALLIGSIVVAHRRWSR